LEAFERLGAVRRFAADCFFALVRRFVAVRRLAVVRRFAAARRFNGARFFRDERDAAARFLRFAIGCLLSESSTLSKKISSQSGSTCKGISALRVRIERHSLAGRPTYERKWMRGAEGLSPPKLGGNGSLPTM
jgi:hypothetical protein